jgi:hypothetical protein
MLSSIYLFIPIILQSLIVGFDEVYFHNRRELPRQEQLGHAMDTLTVLVCFSLALLVPPTTHSVLVYTALSIFSCLFIIKDEFGWHTPCGQGERVSHALAFMLHPIVFISVGLLWPSLHPSGEVTNFAPPLLALIRYNGNERYLVTGNAVLLTLFTFYEVAPRDLIWRNVGKQINEECA